MFASGLLEMRCGTSTALLVKGLALGQPGSVGPRVCLLPRHIYSSPFGATKQTLENPVPRLLKLQEPNLFLAWVWEKSGSTIHL